MYASYITNICILILCALCSARVFFLRYGRRDALSATACIALAVAVGNLAVLGASTASVLSAVVALVASVTNFRALLRFGSDLYVDHYSIPFKVASILIMAVVAASLAVLITFHPFFEKIDHYNITSTRTKLSGSFSQGFHPSRPFEKSNALVTVTRPTVAMAGDAVIVLLGDKRANRENYLPLISALSNRGATVVFGEFFSGDARYTFSAFDNRSFRKFALRLESFFSGSKFDVNKEFYSFNVARELEVLYSKAKEFDQGVFIVTDWMGDAAVNDFCAAHGGEAGFLGAFHFTNNEIAIQESDILGFGLLRTTEPYLSFLRALSYGGSFFNTVLAVHAAINTKGINDLADYIIEQTKKAGEQ